MDTIQYGNILLRPMELQDQTLVLEWRSNPELSKFMYTDLQSPSLENQINWFKQIKNNKTFRYWIIETRNEKVGVVNLAQFYPEHLRTDWAFYIGSPQARGAGLGAKVEIAIINYVFKHLKLQKLCCQVLSTNEPVIKLHKKFGFEVEGILRRHFFRNNAWQDVYLMSLFEDNHHKDKYLLNDEIIIKTSSVE